jgi:hypothetical protein
MVLIFLEKCHNPINKGDFYHPTNEESDPIYSFVNIKQPFKLNMLIQTKLVQDSRVIYIFQQTHKHIKKSFFIIYNNLCNNWIPLHLMVEILCKVRGERFKNQDMGVINYFMYDWQPTKLLEVFHDNIHLCSNWPRYDF